MTVNRAQLVTALLNAQTDQELANIVGQLVQANNPGRPGVGLIAETALLTALGSAPGAGVLGAVGRLFGRLFGRA